MLKILTRGIYMLTGGWDVAAISLLPLAVFFKFSCRLSLNCRQTKSLLVLVEGKRESCIVRNVTVSQTTLMDINQATAFAVSPEL